MKFNSQICTTREQSEKLLALGLKKETADMHWWVIPFSDDWRLSPFPHYDLNDNDIPAWSLHRLIEMLNKSGVTISFVERDTSIIVERYGVFQNVCEIWDNVYDNICDAVKGLIKEGYFNKEYLV